MRNNLYICNANPQTKTTLTSPICGSNFGTHYNPQRLGRQAQGYHLEVREAGDDTDPWHIAERIDQIF